MRTFTFDYDELPLIIYNGIEAAPVNGQVEIHYSADGEWHTGPVTVEGFGRRNPVTGKREWPQVPVPDTLGLMIVRRLENEWCGRVQEAVNLQIEVDRGRAADDEADRRREARHED